MCKKLTVLKYVAIVRLRGAQCFAKLLEYAMSDNFVSSVRAKLLELKKIDDQIKELQARRIQLVAEDESIDVLKLSVHANKYLNADGIYYISQLCGRSEKELLCVPSLGRKSVQEVKVALTHLNLSLKLD